MKVVFLGFDCLFFSSDSQFHPQAAGLELAVIFFQHGL